MSGSELSGARRVAFLTPCYNDGGTLLATVASAREYEHAEIAVVDDGSDDPYTHEVLAELEADGVTVLRQENRGPGAARSAALHATTAPYVFPLDADDLVVADTLAELVAALDADPDAALAWGDIRFFGESSRIQADDAVVLQNVPCPAAVAVDPVAEYRAARTPPGSLPCAGSEPPALQHGAAAEALAPADRGSAGFLSNEDPAPERRALPLEFRDLRVVAQAQPQVSAGLRLSGRCFRPFS